MALRKASALILFVMKKFEKADKNSALFAPKEKDWGQNLSFS